MCLYTNEHLAHPLEGRVKRLERLLEDALQVLIVKATPGDRCLMDALIDDIIITLNTEIGDE